VNTPFFIAFEGIDASGKSTQAQRLLARLATELSIDAILTREPGGTAAGERIRSLVLHTEPGVDVAPRTEALLMAAARAQHIDEVVRPALARGRSVICDRYIGSSMAYQGVGRGLGVDEVRSLNEWATEGLWPDLTVLIDVSVDVAASRLQRSRGPAGLDRLESGGREFMELAAAAFRELAVGHIGGTWLRCDGSMTEDDVARSVWSGFTTWLAGRAPAHSQ
jgi:dTMP kinase